MFSLQHFFSSMAPVRKMEIHKFLLIMSAVNLPPSPLPFHPLLSAPRSVFTRIPQYCTTAAAAATVVALSNWLASTSKPCWCCCCCCFCCSSHSKREASARSYTHARASANTLQAGVRYFSLGLSDPTDLKTLVWDGTHSLRRLPARLDVPSRC